SQRQVGTVQRVEMKLAHSIRLQESALLGGNRGGDETARLGIVIESLELGRHPVRHRCAALSGEFLHLGEIGHRQYPGHDWNGDPGSADPFDKADEDIDVEEELSDRAIGAGVNLAFEIVEVRFRAPRLRVTFREGGNADLEIADPTQSCDEIGSVAITIGMWGVALITGGGIGVERPDVAG